MCSVQQSEEMKQSGEGLWEQVKIRHLVKLGKLGSCHRVATTTHEHKILRSHYNVTIVAWLQTSYLATLLVPDFKKAKPHNTNMANISMGKRNL